MPTTRHARLTASEPGDAADQAVAFLEAAHLQEHSVMLVLQQPALNAGALAPAIASSCWSGPKDPPRRDGTRRRRPRSGTGATTSMPWWSLPPDPLVAARRW
jgi:hypothetical protein